MKSIPYCCKRCRRLIVAIYLIAFVSGEAALIYEISWSRQIGLLLGRTIYSAGIVLATYFAGMAVGYLIGAKILSRIRPLMGYAGAELLAAGWAFTIPILIRLSESSSIGVWLSNPNLPLQTAIRSTFCFLLILPATTALGATLPLMADILARGSCDSNSDIRNTRRISLGYSINTLGAFLGTLIATFFLIATVGVKNSSYFAAALSTLCSGAAILLDRILRPQDTYSEYTEGNLSKNNAVIARVTSPRLGLYLAISSGFTVLAYEVLYTRMFSLVFHNSTYTFGTVIAVVLASLALGAALAYRLERCRRIETVIGSVAGLSALVAMVSVVVFVRATGLKYFSIGESFAEYVAGAFVLVACVLTPPLTLLGVLLPLVWKSAGLSSSAGQKVGRLTAANALSAAAGSLAASFILLPWFGLWESFVIVGSLPCVIGIILLWRARHSLAACGLMVAFVVSGLFALRSPIDADFERVELGEQLVRRWNSAYGWIDVVKLPKSGVYKIRQNLHYRFGGTDSTIREARQSHLPLLLHDNPKDVLFMGLGTGLTAGGALSHAEVERSVVVELIPEVVDAARMLASDNHNVVDHPKVEIHVDDATHYLQSSQYYFDVIVSDLFVPWESETGYLYTVEHYRRTQNRLKSGGLFCQWLPLYQMSARDFEIIANSFATVFPVTTIWWGEISAQKPIVALVGSEFPIEVNAGRLTSRLQILSKTSEIDEMLKSISRFQNCYCGDWKVRTLNLLNTDEYPVIEFSTPISNRDRDILSGPALIDFFDAVLAELPSGAFRMQSNLDDPAISPRSRCTWQRLILSGGIDP